MSDADAEAITVRDERNHHAAHPSENYYCPHPIADEEGLMRGATENLRPGPSNLGSG